MVSLDVDEVGGFRPSEREDDFCPEGSFMRETDSDFGWNFVRCSAPLSMLSMTSSWLVSSSWGLDEAGRAELAEEVETVSSSLGLEVTTSAELTETGVAI